MSLLRVENLSTKLVKTNKLLVDGVSFNLKKGKCLGILGESGSGKSMTIKSIVGLLDKDFEVSGRVFYKDDDILNNRSKLKNFMGNKITMILQHPMSSFDPLCTIMTHVIETYKAHMDISKNEIKDRFINILAKLNLHDQSILEKYPHQLSGGMLQRIMIGLSLSMGPELIICDEPCSALDSISGLEILKILSTLKNENTSMIYISHNLGEISYLADEVIVMAGGKIGDRGSLREIIRAPKNPYTKKLIESRLKLMNHFNNLRWKP